MIATSRSLPLISSLSDRPPSYIDSAALGTGSALAVTFEMILTLSLRTEGADERLVAPLVSEGRLDLVRLEVDLGPCEVDLALVVVGIAKAHSLIAEMCFRFLRDASLSVQ